MNQILYVPDPILRQTSKKIKKITSKEIDISKKMIKIIERTIKKPPSLKTYSAALSFIFLLLNAVFSFKLKFFLSFTALFHKP